MWTKKDILGHQLGLWKTLNTDFSTFMHQTTNQLIEKTLNRLTDDENHFISCSPTHVAHVMP